MDIEYKLRQALNSENLSPIEIEITMEIITDLDIIVSNTATSLAQKYFTSTTTINRLSKKLGFESYSDFRSTIKLKLNEILKNDYVSALSAYLENIDFEYIHENAKIFTKGERYIIFGLGASNISAQAFQRQMIMLGYNVMICDWDNVNFCIENNNLVIISSTGETHEALMLINQVKDKTNQIISITKKSSTVQKLSDIAFCHDVNVTKELPLLHEQQTHIHIIISEIINELNK
ncbi:MAG: MurR/RpiR family transcriptional regulator [Anaerocolumna sp.]